MKYNHQQQYTHQIHIDHRREKKTRHENEQRKKNTGNAIRSKGQSSVNVASEVLYKDGDTSKSLIENGIFTY